MNPTDIVHHLTPEQRNRLMLWTAEHVLDVHRTFSPEDDVTDVWTVIEHLRNGTVTLDNVKLIDHYSGTNISMTEALRAITRDAALSSLDSPWTKRSAGLSIERARYIQSYADAFWAQVAVVLDVPEAHRELWTSMASDWDATPTDLTDTVRKLHT